jgi:predicted amidophosphoribosyltransferase
MSWAAWQLATALNELGLARGVWSGLRRTIPVPRSATALLGQRPTVRQHYESLTVEEKPCTPPHRMVLIDDVITKGRTLLAAAARLRDDFPHSDITAFALVRTMGFLRRVDRLVAPCEGFVYWMGGDARREP